MSSDPRVRYVVTTPCTKRDGSTHWLRVGTAYLNQDQTIDVYCEVVATGLHLRLREMTSDDSSALPAGAPS